LHFICEQKEQLIGTFAFIHSFEYIEKMYNALCSLIIQQKTKNKKAPKDLMKQKLVFIVFHVPIIISPSSFVPLDMRRALIQLSI
jgi:hypothetical protein